MLLSESRATSVDAGLEERRAQQARLLRQAGFNFSEASLKSGRKTAKRRRISLLPLDSASEAGDFFFSFLEKRSCPSCSLEPSHLGGVAALLTAAIPPQPRGANGCRLRLNPAALSAVLDLHNRAFKVLSRAGAGAELCPEACVDGCWLPADRGRFVRLQMEQLSSYCLLPTLLDRCWGQMARVQGCFFYFSLGAVQVLREANYLWLDNATRQSPRVRVSVVCGLYCRGCLH